MKAIETGFKGLLLLEPKLFNDDRGYFMESYNAMTLSKLGIETGFVQDNQSCSRKGVVRGLHFQNAPYAQSKLVSVSHGIICDFVVDLRVGEPTFKKTFLIELSAANKLQLFVPKGFAHGFVTLSDYAVVAYKCDEYYSPKHEGGIHYADPEIGLTERFDFSEAIVSSKDDCLPPLSQACFSF